MRSFQEKSSLGVIKAPSFDRQETTEILALHLGIIAASLKYNFKVEFSQILHFPLLYPFPFPLLQSFSNIHFWPKLVYSIIIASCYKTENFKMKIMICNKKPDRLITVLH